jgi:hypothetical protein
MGNLNSHLKAMVNSSSPMAHPNSLVMVNNSRSMEHLPNINKDTNPDIPHAEFF